MFFIISVPRHLKLVFNLACCRLANVDGKEQLPFVLIFLVMKHSEIFVKVLLIAKNLLLASVEIEPIAMLAIRPFAVDAIPFPPPTGREQLPFVRVGVVIVEVITVYCLIIVVMGIYA